MAGAGTARGPGPARSRWTPPTRCRPPSPPSPPSRRRRSSQRLAMRARAAVAACSNPKGVAVDGSGNIYVVTGQAIEKLDSTGNRQETWGPLSDGPVGLAIDTAGHVYVAETGNGTGDGRVDEFDQHGQLLGTFGLGFNESPTDVAVDDAGNVYMTNNFLHRIEEFNPADGLVLAWGSIAPVQPSLVMDGIAVDASGHVFVANGGGIDKYDSTGLLLARWRSSSSRVRRGGRQRRQRLRRRRRRPGREVRQQRHVPDEMGFDRHREWGVPAPLRHQHRQRRQHLRLRCAEQSGPGVRLQPPPDSQQDWSRERHHHLGRRNDHQLWSDVLGGPAHRHNHHPARRRGSGSSFDGWGGDCSGTGPARSRWTPPVT